MPRVIFSRIFKKPPAFKLEEIEDLPASVDWAEEGKVNPTIPAQGGCGGCWTFAATATVESALAIATGEDPISLSEQTMLDCTPNPDQCGGTSCVEKIMALMAFSP